MYRSLLLLMTLMAFSSLSSLEHLDSKYCVKFGSNEAPIKIVKYFSFACPQCMRVYEEDFKTLRDRYQDEVQWIFHPYPKDIYTVKTMACFERLETFQKQVLMESLCDLAFSSQDGMNADEWGALLDDYLMNQGVEPIGLSDARSLPKTEAFHSAYQFVQQKDLFLEVPTVEVDGKLYDHFPSKEFIEQIIQKKIKTGGLS